MRLMVCSLEYAIVVDVSAPLCGGVPSECVCAVQCWLAGWQMIRLSQIVGRIIPLQVDDRLNFHTGVLNREEVALLK